MGVRKFKHKITGDIVESSCESGYYKDTNIPMGTLIPGKYIEKSNDWEEIIEKDYEILSFINIEDGNIFDDIRSSNWSNKKLYYSKKTGTWVNEASGKGYSIHSIKRISDGEVFTIGDRIECENKGIITRFEIDDLSKSGVTVYCDTNIIIDYNNCCLSYIKKVKTPIFKTFDGVDLFQGDQYWFIVISDISLTRPWVARLDTINWKNPEMPPLGRIQFSTKEAAEDYIFKNKPCLSYNEVSELYRNYFMDSESPFTFNAKLINKVKEKLK